MTTETISQNKCFYIRSEKGKWGVQKLLEPISPVYNSVGWFIEEKYHDQALHISQQLDMPLIEWDLGEETFEELRRKQKTSYLYDKSIKLKIAAENIKATLMISELDNESILESKHREELEKIPEGRKLLDCLEEASRLQGQIKVREFEEKSIKNIPNSYKHFLESNSLEQIKNELQIISSDVRTGFTINNEPLEIPGGALTIVAAPTSHGKTAFLINLALGVIKQHKDKKVIFISYEEAMASISTLFINSWIGQDFSKNNRKSIRHYLRTGELDFVNSGQRDAFISNIRAFEEHILTPKKLHVNYSELFVEDLINAIRYIKKEAEDSIIFIDYMQFLRSRNGSRSRQEELKDICLQLKDCAIDTGLPLVLAAQFNRSVDCEGKLSPLAIGEAGDIERAANMIIGFWNRNFDGLSIEGNRDKKGIKVPKEHALYVEIMKRRADCANISDVLDFNGNTGVISNRTYKPKPMHYNIPLTTPKKETTKNNPTPY